MNWADLNQYERATARMHVEGYMVIRRHGESDTDYFERSKADALRQLQLQVERVRCMGFHDMYPKAKAQPSHPAKEGTS